MHFIWPSLYMCKCVLYIYMKYVRNAFNRFYIHSCMCKYLVFTVNGEYAITAACIISNTLQAAAAWHSGLGVWKFDLIVFFCWYDHSDNFKVCCKCIRPYSWRFSMTSSNEGRESLSCWHYLLLRPMMHSTKTTIIYFSFLLSPMTGVYHKIAITDHKIILVDKATLLLWIIHEHIQWILSYFRQGSDNAWYTRVTQLCNCLRNSYNICMA